MPERIDAFCKCGHKVFDYEPGFSFSGYVTCSECTETSSIYLLTFAKREKTKEEKIKWDETKRLSVPI